MRKRNKYIRTTGGKGVIELFAFMAFLLYLLPVVRLQQSLMANIYIQVWSRQNTVITKKINTSMM